MYKVLNYTILLALFCLFMMGTFIGTAEYKYDKIYNPHTLIDEFVYNQFHHFNEYGAITRGIFLLLFSIMFLMATMGYVVGYHIPLPFFILDIILYGVMIYMMFLVVRRLWRILKEDFRKKKEC